MTLRCVDTAQSSDNRAAFSAWARLYDALPNPLLALEERYLARVLPTAHGKDVLDAGCGTGRWLRQLADRSPRSLYGIDSSAEMLAFARRGCTGRTMLIMAELPLLPLISRSIDLAICSFVLSYVSEISVFAQQLRRVLRDGGDLLISDMHPETASALGWHRSFHNSGAHFDLLTHNRSIGTIQHAFEEQGFEVVALYQPAFGAPELPIFNREGKEASYTDALGHPAIYALHLRPASQNTSRRRLTLKNTRIIIGSQESDSGDVSITDEHLASFMGGGRNRSTGVSLDLSGYTLFPGLINAHDHLEFGLFPRLGRPPYKNATEWARDIQDRFASTIKKHNAVPRDVRLWWGALRNLLCGVTTVCHHNPAAPVLQTERFPLHVVTGFNWAHSLAFSSDLQELHRRSVPSQPFILHACEGLDETARAEFAQLLDMNVVDERTVLVHGLAMTSDQVEMLNLCGASLISCPTSNKFLFSRAPLYDQLAKVNRLAIGSDSPLTADGDLLDEISFCQKTLEMPPATIFDLVTSAPAEILRLNSGVGSIFPDASADLFAVRSSVVSPAEHLVSISWHDVELVLVGGIVRLASDELFHRLPASLRGDLEPLTIDGIIRWINSPVSSLFESAASVLGVENITINGRRVTLPAIAHGGQLNLSC